jgi:hypothetical protein
VARLLTGATYGWEREVTAPVFASWDFHRRLYAGTGPDGGTDRGAFCEACSDTEQDYVWPCRRPPASDFSASELSTVARFDAAPDAFACPQGDDCTDQTPCGDCPEGDAA